MSEIFCCDCLEGMAALADDAIDVSFTSPPYNRIRNDVYDHYDDTKSDYYDFLVQVTDEMIRVTKKDVIVNLQMTYFNKEDICNYIGNYSKQMKGIVIWQKTNPQPNTNKRDDSYSITNSWEYFFVLGKDNTDFRANHRIKNIISTSVNDMHFASHHAVMKKEVCEFFIENFTKEGDVVLDPFMGCGTTAVCCMERGRKFIGFEIIQEYCDIAYKRIQQAKELGEQITLF